MYLSICQHLPELWNFVLLHKFITNEQFKRLMISIKNLRKHFLFSFRECFVKLDKMLIFFQSLSMYFQIEAMHHTKT